MERAFADARISQDYYGQLQEQDSSEMAITELVKVAQSLSSPDWYFIFYVADINSFVAMS